MIKGCKSIAEYAIRKWLQKENFVMSEFQLEMHGNEGILTDSYGENMKLVFDLQTKEVRTE